MLALYRYPSILYFDDSLNVIAVELVLVFSIFAPIFAPFILPFSFVLAETSASNPAFVASLLEKVIDLPVSLSIATTPMSSAVPVNLALSKLTDASSLSDNQSSLYSKLTEDTEKSPLLFFSNIAVKLDLDV